MEEQTAGFSYLRSIACMAIVALHTCFFAVSNFQTSESAVILTMCVRNSLLWAVPCFVMITGALLLDERRSVSLKKLWGRYILRIARALLLATAAFFLFDRIISGDAVSFQWLPEWLSVLLTGSSWSHIWYLYMLLGIYFLLPAYRAAARTMTNAEMKYCLVICIIFQVIVPLLSTVSGKTIAFYICMFTVYPVYLFAGHALSKGVFIISRKAAVCLLLLSESAILVLTAVSIREDSTMLKGLLNNYSFLPVFLETIAVFSLFMEADCRRHPGFHKILLHVDKSSFGIYLLHMVVIRMFFQVWHINPFVHGGPVGLTVVALISFILPLGFVSIYQSLRKYQKV